MKMAERYADLNADIINPDPAFDVYRLEAVIADLRGHHPDDLDFERIFKCTQARAAFLNAKRRVA